MHTHMNRPNSSLDWVLSHWAHFTVLRFLYMYYCMHVQYHNFAFSSLTLLVWQQEGHPACKKYGEDGGGGHWFVWMEWRPARWLVWSASVNLPFHHKVQKFSSGTGSPGWSRKKGRKTVVVW